VLVWDGACGFCRRAVEWLRAQGPDDVRFVPYQNISAAFDGVNRSEFEEAVFLFLPSGDRYRGAEAIFECLDLGPGPAVSVWLYRFFPRVDRLSEWTYRFVAEHRSLFATVSWLLFGASDKPSRWYVGRWLFFRGLALVFLIAFASLGVQVLGLIGPEGIVPAESTVDRAQELRSQSGETWYTILSRFPSLFLWLDPTGPMLQGACVLGALLSLLLLIGFWPRGLLVMLWVLYLSLVSIGGPFLSYQWDTLLLETTCMALFIAPAQFLPGGDQRRVSVRAVFLLHWLLFRVLFSSGFVKLLSLDPVWHDGTALSYHFWTQPLPNQVSYYVHQLPEPVLFLGTLGAFFAELILPFLFFAPRTIRRLAGVGTIVLQFTIMATGNYGFFNLLTIVIGVLLIDDAFWRAWMPGRLRSVFSYPEPPDSTTWTLRTKIRHVSHAVMILLLFCGTSLLLIRQLQNSRAERTAERQSSVRFDVPSWFEDGYQALRGFRTFNTYGLFANMTTERPEIIIEGSRDGTEWKRYRFRWKPDSTTDAPRFVAPHQPRLDWQMWFQALSMHRRAQHCPRLLERIGVRERTFRRKLCGTTRWLKRNDLQLLRALSRNGVEQPITWTYRNLWGYQSWFFQFLNRLLEGKEPVVQMLEHNPFPGTPPKYVRVRLKYLRFPSGGDKSGSWWVREKERGQGWPFRLRDGQLNPARSPD